VADLKGKEQHILHYSLIYSNIIFSVGYVEFKNEESVPAAIQLTGQKLLGIPIIAQLTEAEKNRQVRNPETTGSKFPPIDCLWVISISALLKATYRMFLNLLVSSSLCSFRRKNKDAVVVMDLCSKFPYHSFLAAKC
jgi:hypothetical protein